MKTRREPSGLATWASAQGSRPYQEDRAVCQWIETGAGEGWLLAVFDGHRGAASAEQAAKALPTLFSERLAHKNGDAEAALLGVYHTLGEMTREHLSGSTASICFIPAGAKVATLAVLGDSPIAVLDGRGKAHIGPEHNVRTNLAERAAAESRGGVYRGGYLEDEGQPGIGLQMSRSLGDADLSRILGRTPEIESVPLGGKGIVLVGTDGLLSPGSGSYLEQLARLLDMANRGADAQGLVTDALARGTDDNVTAVVWRSI